MYPLVTTWDEVCAQLLPAIQRLGPPRPQEKPAARTPSTPPFDSPVYGGAAMNPDAGLNTLRYLFFHTRCGIWVSIRNGTVALFTPFANRAYTNTFGDRVVLGAEGLTVAEYAGRKARVTRHAKEDLLPDVRTWWLNGGIVCNVLPADVWGPEYLAAIRDMLDETCARHAVPDCDFAVNKRDFPQLCRDLGKDPYGVFTGDPALAREAYSTYLPVFSFYTGSAMADVPMPTCDDWATATGKWLPCVSAAPYVPMVSTLDAMPRTPIAIFRGTASGAGTTAATNARLRLVQFGLRRPDLVDAKLTGFNLRDRVVATTHDSMVVDFFADFETYGKAKAPFCPLAEQERRFEYVLYVDGHCAASRFGTLLATSMVVIRVASAHPTTCGQLWLFDSTVPVVLGGDGGDSPDPDLHPDHCLVHADLSNLEATILYLRGNPEFARKMVGRANSRAPTVDTITAHWRAMLQGVHDLETGSGGDPDGCEWFSPYDPKYACSEM